MADFDTTIKEISEALDKFEAEIGIPPNKKMEWPKCLELSLVELRKKSSEDLAEYTYEINMYALYIQREINKQRAWERWVKSRLDEISAGYIPEIPTNYGFNERVLMARHNPEICKRLNAFARQIAMQLDRLYDIPNNIKILGESIREMRFSAMKREKIEGNSNND